MSTWTSWRFKERKFMPTKKVKLEKSDVSNKSQTEGWFYTDTVKDHFFNPRNLFYSDEDAEGYEYDAVGMVGSPACGDMMKIWIKCSEEQDCIKECKWQTFGCASAIASTSIMSEMVTEGDGMKLDDAMSMKPKDINDKLGGLPTRKFHCSVLGDKALRMAINNYYDETGQPDRKIEEKTRIIDKLSKTTDHDIEEAVLEGARTFEEVQKKTKVGIGNPKVQMDVEQLLRFYVEKYFGENAL